MAQVKMLSNLEHNKVLYEFGKVYDLADELVAKFGPEGAGKHAILEPLQVVAQPQPAPSQPEVQASPVQPAAPAAPAEEATE